MSIDLTKSTAKYIAKAVKTADDHLIRVELGPTWPIDPIIDELRNIEPAVKIGVMQNLRSHVHDMDAIRDAALLTKMRNRRRKSEDPKPLVLFGLANGSQEAGLQKLSVVLNRRDIAFSWWEAVNAQLSRSFSSGGLVFRQHIGEFVAKRVGGGVLQPESADLFMKLILDPDVESAVLQDSLYLIGMIPDDGLATSSGGKRASFLRRMEQNLAVLDTLSGLSGDPQKAHRITSTSTASSQALMSWSESHNNEDLKGAELTAVLDILSPGPGPTPPRPPSTESFLEALGNPARSESQRQQLIKWASELVGPLGHQLSEIVGKTEDAVGNVDFALRSSGKIDDQWWIEAPSPNDDDLLEPPEDQVLLRLEVTNPDARKSASESFLASNILSSFVVLPAVQEKLVDYLDCRQKVIVCNRLLSCPDGEVLSLLVASAPLREIFEEYIAAWLSLLSVGTTGGGIGSQPSLELLALLDGLWCRDTTVGEDGSVAQLHWKSAYKRAEFACWHPWRMNSLLRLSSEIGQKIDTSGEVAKAAVWAMDQAVPSYRVYQTPGSLLEFKSTEEGSLIYRSEIGNRIPPLSGRANRIEVALRAYANTHPWSSAGAIIQILNPPRGGAVRKLVESALSAFQHEPAIALTRQDRLSGLDQTDDFPNLILSVNISSEESLEAGNFDRDVVVAFVEGPGTNYGALKQGAFGSVGVELLSKGFDPVRGETYVPQLTIGPDETDDLIRLPHLISGIGQVQVAEAELVLPTHVVEELTKLVQGAGWLIVAVPSTIASFELPDGNGGHLSRIAEFSQGAFRCFVYASSTGPVIAKIQREIEKYAVNLQGGVQLVDVVNELVKTQPQKLFEVSSSLYGAQEALGIIATRAVAESWHKEDSLRVEISLDDSSWTSSWMSGEGERADFLVIEVSHDTSAAQPIRILIAESKATAAEFEKPNLAKQPLAKASAQVDALRGRLSELIDNRNISLIEGIRFRAFIEHVASVAASQYREDSDTEKFTGYFENLSRFASEGSSAVSEVAGLACVLYLSGLEPLKASTANGMMLVSCSAKLLEGILTGQQIPSPWDTAEALTDPVGSSGQESGQQTTSAVAVGNGSEGPSVSRGESTSSLDEDDPDFQLFLNVSTTLRQRSEHIGPRAEDQLLVGPTFLIGSFVLKEGATLAPLTRVAADIARDSGVARVEIRNSEEKRGRVEVLIPRISRVFPQLPGGASIVGEQSEDYLTIALGQDLAGNDVWSSLSSWPHALVAGTTGSGKSTFLRSSLKQLGDLGAHGVQLIVVDGKAEADYFGVVPVGSFVEKFPEPLMNVSEALVVLDWLTNEEIPRRKELIQKYSRDSGSRFDLRADFIRRTKDGVDPIAVPLVIVIDEFNELMIRGGTQKDEFVDAVTSITGTARSQLVHLVLATQRPDKNVVPGVVKANLTTRLSFRLPTPSDSVTVLGHGGAESLLGRGDFRVQIPGKSETRLQGYLF